MVGVPRGLLCGGVCGVVPHLWVGWVVWPGWCGFVWCRGAIGVVCTYVGGVWVPLGGVYACATTCHYMGGVVVGGMGGCGVWVGMVVGAVGWCVWVAPRVVWYFVFGGFRYMSPPVMPIWGSCWGRGFLLLADLVVVGCVHRLS